MSSDSHPDTIFLRDLRVETIVGLWDWERKIRQTVSIDLEMGADIRKAAGTDSIDDTLNYKSVAKRVQQFVSDSEFLLVETMAEKIAETIPSSICLGSTCASTNLVRFVVHGMSACTFDVTGNLDD